MTISPQAIADFAGALDATRNKLAGVNNLIASLESKRRRIIDAPPHTDDIAAVFLRGLTDASQTFKQQLGARLKDTFEGADGKAAQAASPRSSAELLRLEAKKPDSEALVTRSMLGAAPELNVAALTYFLRDQLEAEIPTLIDKLCPAAREGIKQADRERQLKDIDGELATLMEEREQLNAGLGAARAAVR